MQALSRWVGIGSVALFALACGSKGSDDGGAGASGAGAPAGGGAAPQAGASPADGGAPAGGGASNAGSSAGGDTMVGSGGALQGYTFDADKEAWKVEFSNSGPLPGTAGAGGSANYPEIPVADIMVTWLGTDGNPATPPGALQVAIPYSTPSQYVSVGVSLTTPLDLTGKILHAKVKVVSGLGTDLDKNPGGAKLYVKTGTLFKYAAGMYTNLSAIGTWIPLSLDVMDPATLGPAGAIDPTAVVEIGIQFDTGGTTMTAMPAVELIDSVTY